MYWYSHKVIWISLALGFILVTVLGAVFYLTRDVPITHLPILLKRQVEVSVTSEHPAYTADLGSLFDYQTLAAQFPKLQYPNLHKLTLILTDQPQQHNLREYDQTGETRLYRGYGFAFAKKELTISLFIDENAVLALERDAQRVREDVYQLLFLALMDFERSQTNPQGVMQSEYNQIFNENYLKSAAMAEGSLSHLDEAVMTLNEK